MFKKSLLALVDFNILTGEQDSFDFNDKKICYGKGSGSSGGGGTTNSTVTNVSNPPPEVTAAYEQALSQAQSAASAPLQQYQGQTVAPLNSTENSAFGTINNVQGIANPYINAASNLIGQGTQPLWSGVQQFSPSAVQQYQSPYTQNVLQTSMAAQQNQDQQQQAALQGNAISSGAWGGDRAGVASAILRGQQDIANNATNANIENTGYNTALGEFNTQQQAQLGANEANSYLAQQGAFGLGNLGNEAQNTALTGANAQLAAGQLQQQQTQSQLNVPYEQFLQQQAYPFQTAQYYANIAEGIGSNSGGTGNGTSSTTAPAPSTASQVGGLGLGLGGLLGGFLAANRGGRIKGYAPGGAINDVPDLSVSYIPNTSSARGPGPPQSGIRSPNTINPNGAAPSPQSLAAAGKGFGSLANLLKGSSSGSGNELSNPLDAGSSSSATDVGGQSNPLDVFSSGNLDTSGTGAASDAGSSALDSSGSGLSDLFSSFAKGGRTHPYAQHSVGQGNKYAVGGEVLPDIISGVGDIVGAFFGDPGAGDQGVGILSNADGGATKGAGVEGQLFGMAEGKSHSAVEDSATGTPGEGLNSLFDFNSNNNPITANTSNSGATQQQQEGLGGLSGLQSQIGNGGGLAASIFLKRGGTAHPRHYDVGGATPLTDQTSGQQQPTSGSTLNNLTPQQLQNILIRLPPGSPQAGQAQAVLQQKRMLPNVGAQAQGGFGQQTQQIPTTPTVQPMAQPGMARGGRMHFDDGGSIPDPATPDAIQRQLELQGEVNADTPDAAQEYRAANGMANPPITAQRESMGLPVGSNIPMGNPPTSGGMGNRQMVASATPPSYSDDEEESAPDTAAKSNHRDPNPWLALAAAGFGMAAGTSPYAGVNIGRGALEGLSNYGQQQKESDTVNDASDKLMQEAKYHKDQIAIEQQNADTSRMGVKQKELVKDAFGNPMGYADPTTNSIVPIKGMAPASLQTAGASTAGTDTAPVNPELAAQVSSLPSDVQARLAKYPPQAQPMILKLIQGQIPADRQHLGTNPAAYLNAAADVDPTFDLAKPNERMKTVADYSTAGQSGKSISQLDYATKHAAQLSLASMDLNNTGSVPLLNTAWNSMANKAEAASGDPRVTNFQNTLNSYAPEVTKFISGKSNFAEKELEDVQNAIPQNGSLAQQLGAISQKNGMMLSRAQTMQDQYDKAMGPYGQQRQVIRPETQAAMGDMDSLYRAARDGTTPDPAAVARLKAYAAGTPASIPPVEQRIKGQTYTNPNGHSAVWTGTGWTSP